jgi:DNA transposition AAA+ family ATPase
MIATATGKPADAGKALDTLSLGATRMADRDGEMSRAEMDRVIEQCREVQVLEEISDEDIGRVLRCSASTWNRVKSWKYRGDFKRVLQRARAWLGERATQAPMRTGEYVQTSIARMVMTVCHRATKRNTIGLVVAPAGTGKTLALGEYARQLADKAILLYGGEACHAKAGVAWELAERLGVHCTHRGSTAVVYKAVRKRLAGMYAGGRAAPVTILVDEATAMRPEAINLLRNLHDDPATRTPLVLADTWALDRQLHAARGLPGGYEQLRSRAGAHYLLRADAEISLDDVRLVAESVLATMGEAGRMPAKALQFLHRQVANQSVRMDGRQCLAMRPGALRNVMQRLHAVADVCEAAGREPAWSVAELDGVAALVGLDMANPDTPSPFAPAMPAGTDAPPARAAG